jgi:hypothetical protein
MLDTLEDEKPNPLADIDNILPPGRTSSEYVRSFFDVPRTSLTRLGQWDRFSLSRLAEMLSADKDTVN